ncbi:MAG: hypothetical protein ACXVPQ_06140 [Bacteroidia bacterium]
MPFIRFLSHSHIKFLFKTWLCLMSVFFLIRSIFYFVNHDPSLHSSLYTSAFFVGFRFDNIVICYCLILPFLVLSAASFMKQKIILYHISFSIICLELVFVELILCANISHFRQFDTLVTPEGFTQVKGWIYGLFALIYFISVFFIRGYFYQLKEDEKDFPDQKSIFKIAALIIFSALIFLGTRGAFNPQTLEAARRISDDNFTNNLGMNPVYSMYKPLTGQEPHP